MIHHFGHIENVELEGRYGSPCFCKPKKFFKEKKFIEITSDMPARINNIPIIRITVMIISIISIIAMMLLVPLIFLLVAFFSEIKGVFTLKKFSKN
jgi:hypothetical protein